MFLQQQLMLRKKSPYIPNSSKPKKKPTKKKVIVHQFDVFIPQTTLSTQRLPLKKQIKSLTTRQRQNHLKTKKKLKTEPIKEYQKLSRLSSPDFIKSAINIVVNTIQEEGIQGAWNSSSSDHSVERINQNPSPQQSYLFNTTWDVNFPLSSTKSQKVISKKCQLIPPPEIENPICLSARNNCNSYIQPAFFYQPSQFHYYNNSNSSFKPESEVEDFTVIQSNILEDLRTTVYIRHIPNKYTLYMLQEEIDKTHKGRYDFLHLPFDYENNCNRGYAFINFWKQEDLKRFFETYKGRKWKHFRSEKRCEIKYACIQGKEALVSHFHHTKVYRHSDDKFRPIFRNANEEEIKKQ